MTAYDRTEAIRYAIALHNMGLTYNAAKWLRHKGYSLAAARCILLGV